MSSRYFVADSERYEGTQVRFVYDRKYKRFVTIQVNSSQGFTTVKKANDENFYVYFPGFAEKLRETDRLPKWA
jgi:hypothetical protein